MKEYIVPFKDDADFDEFDKIYVTNGELIRCEYCIHHHGYMCDRLIGFQDAFNLQDYDYCSRAEKEG